MGNPVRNIDPNGCIPFDKSVRNGKITSKFGRRFHPIHKVWKGHGGVDIAIPTGSSVHVVADGVVKKVGWDKKGYGRYIVIKHAYGYESLYAHLQADGVMVTVGDKVSEDDIIGKSGNTGGSTGPHLHIEIGQGNILNSSNKRDPAAIGDLQKLLSSYQEEVFDGGIINGIIVTESKPVFQFLQLTEFKIDSITKDLSIIIDKNYDNQEN